MLQHIQYCALMSQMGGRDSRPQARQLWARSGLMQCNKNHYSIASAAAPKSFWAQCTSGLRD
jgi:hypothetical protein